MAPDEPPTDPYKEHLCLKPGTAEYDRAKQDVAHALKEYDRHRTMLDVHRGEAHKQLEAVHHALTQLVAADRQVEPGARVAAGIEADASGVVRFRYAEDAVPRFAAPLDALLQGALNELKVEGLQHGGLRSARDLLVQWAAHIFKTHQQGSAKSRVRRREDFVRWILEENGLDCPSDSTLRGLLNRPIPLDVDVPPWIGRPSSTD